MTDTRRYWALIRKWLWFVVVGVAIAGSAAYVVSSRMQPMYRATATVVVQDTTSPIPGYEYSQPAVAVHAKLMTKESVMEEVITEVGLPYSTTDLRKKISAQTSPGSPLITVSAEDSGAFTAQQIVNTTVSVYIQQHRDGMQEAAQAFLNEIQSQINDTSARIDELEAKQGTEGLTPEEAVELNGLKDDLDSLKTQRTVWYTQLAQAVAAAGGVSVGEMASLPTEPFSPKTLQNVALACILGLLATTGGVFLKEYLNRSVSNAEEIGMLTGLSTLGAIPKFKPNPGQGEGVIAETHPRSSVAEAFRMLRTSLQFATMDKPAQTLMIAAPGPGEGKSSVVANLAVALAQTGKKVIAVDTDLRRGNLHEMFGLGNDFGFSNLLLARQPDVAGYLQATGVARLLVLSVGPSPHNPTDLLGSSRMSFLLDKLKKEADVILFDSAPVLAVADAALLAPKVDGVILVVNAGRTKPEELAEAANLLSKGNARILGVVLNRVERDRSSPYYYHYRSSGYYDEDDEQGEEDVQRRKAPWRFLTRFRRR